MASIRSSRNRSTELALAAAFRSAGITGWRRNVSLPGKPDFVFREHRIAVFVDGCFWHGCPKHGRKPGSNQDYWRNKLARNHARDARVSRILRSRGWRVIRLWEHDTETKQGVAKVARRMGAAIKLPPASKRKITIAT